MPTSPSPDAPAARGVLSLSSRAPLHLASRPPVRAPSSLRAKPHLLPGPRPGLTWPRHRLPGTRAQGSAPHWRMDHRNHFPQPGGPLGLLPLPNTPASHTQPHAHPTTPGAHLPQPRAPRDLSLTPSSLSGDPGPSTDTRGCLHSGSLPPLSVCCLSEGTSPASPRPHSRASQAHPHHSSRVTLTVDSTALVLQVDPPSSPPTKCSVNCDHGKS